MSILVHWKNGINKNNVTKIKWSSFTFIYLICTLQGAPILFANFFWLIFKIECLRFCLILNMTANFINQQQKMILIFKIYFNTFSVDFDVMLQTTCLGVYGAVNCFLRHFINARLNSCLKIVRLAGRFGFWFSLTKVAIL